MSDKRDKGKHADEDWPEDTGKALDDWLAESDRVARGGTSEE